MTDDMTDDAGVAATPRFAACVEYDGEPFSGWQRQDGARTVQAAVEGALSFVADHPVTVVCAGRTDAGVHATGQVVHFSSPARRSDYSWLRGTNTHLPDGVAVHWIREVPADFHARFRARRRRYRYVIACQPVKPALLRARASWDYRELDAGRMARAAGALIGEHDFSAFRAASCQSKNPVKTIYRLDVGRRERFVWLDVEADGFLHHMVRNIAGVLMSIGAGERDIEWCRRILVSRERRAGGVTAPPAGLYLTGVDYDPAYGLPLTPRPPRFW